jgi:hypothetical protein
MSKRTGATLVEVLVAIFVMGIGLLALLALFPLGVLSMAQAIQDDRATHSAADATSLAVITNLHRDGLNADGSTASGFPAEAFTNPAVGNPAITAPDVNGPSWPVYVDAVGYVTAPGLYNQWVGGLQYGIARRPATYVYDFQNPLQPTLNTTKVLQWFTLPDDIRFGVNGAPALLPGTSTFDREGNYSWAYLLRRPRNGNTAAVNMDVIVYSRRALNLTQALTMPEYQYTGSVDLTAANGRPNIITLQWTVGQNPPAVRAGGWILDATPRVTLGNQVTAAPGHAQFYRVVGVNEVANNPYVLEVEIQDNVLTDPANTLGFPPGAASAGTFLVLDGVVEVFPRGTQWRP